MDYIDPELAAEGPCQFCGESYPLFLLWDHQTTHLNEGSYPYDANEDNNFPELIYETKRNEPEKVVANVQSPVNEPKKVEENVQMKSPVNEPKVTKDAVPAQLPKASNRTSETKQNQHKSYPCQAVKEFTMEKLLIYGADIDHVEDSDGEKQSFKMPDNPLLNAIPRVDDVEDINNLSDDDCDESLEEFWKRARDYLKRYRRNI